MTVDGAAPSAVERGVFEDLIDLGRRVAWVRISVFWALIGALGAAVVLNMGPFVQAAVESNSWIAADYLLAPELALVAGVGLGARFYYSQLGELTAMEEEWGAIVRGSSPSARRVRLREAFPRWFLSATRAHELNIWFAVSALIAALVLFLVFVPGYASGFYELFGTLGRWAFLVVAAVAGAVVGVGTALLWRGRMAALRGEIERAADGWDIPPATPDEPSDRSAGVDEVQRELTASADLMYGHHAAVERLARSSRRLLVLVATVVLGAGLAIVVLAVAAVLTAGVIGPFQFVFLVLFLGGTVPVLLLVGPLRPPPSPEGTASAPEGPPPGPGGAADATGSVAREVARTSALVYEARRRLDSTLALAVFGAAWLELVLAAALATPTVSLDPRYLSPDSSPVVRAVYPVLGTLSVVPFLVLAGFLFVWFVRSYRTYLEESKVRAWVAGLADLEGEFWGRF